MNSETDHARPQANPFALPAETDGRFRMLMLTAVLLVWSLAAQVLSSPPLIDEGTKAGTKSRTFAYVGIDDILHGRSISFPSPDELRELEKSPEGERMKEVSLQAERRIQLSVVLMAVFFSVALLVYILLPLAYQSRYRVTPLNQQSAPGVTKELVTLSTAASLRYPPELLVKPGMLDGMAFLRWGRKSLVIGGTPETLESTWSDLHRAVALHEVGHFVNGDIRKRELARALWISLGFTVLVAFGLLMLRLPQVGEVMAFAVHTLGVIAIAWAMWAGLVRAREFYADWRVVTWGFGTALNRRLRLGDAIHSATHSIRSWWPPWRVHPSNLERLRLLQDPSALFATSPLLAGLTGALLGLVAGNSGALAVDFLYIVAKILALIVAATRNPQLIYLFLLFIPVVPIVLILVGKWITDALGIQILRSAIYDLGRRGFADWGYCRLCGIAGAFVAGLEIGLALTPAAFLGWAKAGLFGLWTFAAFLIVWIWLIQTRALGRLWLGICSTEVGKNRMARLLNWIAAVQLGTIFVPLMAFRFALQVLASPEFMIGITASGGLDSNLYPLLSTGAIYLALAFVTFVLLGGGALALSGLWMAVRRPGRCPSCGHPRKAFQTIRFRRCPCGAPNESWLLRPEGGYPRIDGKGSLASCPAPFGETPSKPAKANSLVVMELACVLVFHLALILLALLALLFYFEIAPAAFDSSPTGADPISIDVLKGYVIALGSPIFLLLAVIFAAYRLWALPAGRALDRTENLSA